MANNRIYYAIQQVALGDTANKTEAHGVQSVGVTTNFNLEQVFELGQLAIYQNIENIPEIEVTLNKVLDGYPLLYVMATENGSNVGGTTATSPTIAGRQNARVDVQLSIYPDDEVSATGSSVSAMSCPGMYVSSVSYTFPVDGNFTEDLTLVGNEKVWLETPVTGEFDNNDDIPLATQGVNRRQHLDMDNSLFPTQIPGIGEDGINALIGNGSGHEVHFQNITVSTDLGRETINELGTFAPYHRYVTFPVEVTSEFEVLAIQGDGINASESGYYTATSLSEAAAGNYEVATAEDTGCDNVRFNLIDQTIYLVTCEGTKIHLGDKNKLTSVNYTGGDTGGGNVTVTYSYSNFNDFIVAHSGGDFYDDIDSTGYTG